MSNPHFRVVTPGLCLVAAPAEQLKIVAKSLLPVEADSLRPCHQVMVSSHRDYAVEFEALIRAASFTYPS